MHANNLKWLKDLKQQYPASFKGGSVLELGAEGTWPEVRELFEAVEYVGIDHISGNNVDIVVDAKATQFDHLFSVILCLSMFEHDPDWHETLSHNLQWLKPGGMMFGCHGAEGNLHHGPDPWAVVPAQEFLNYCKTLPVTVVDSFFEEDRYGLDCAGAFDWILVKK